MSMPLEIQEMLVRLGELAVRNSAGAVYTRVQSVKTRKTDQSTTNELVDIINELVEEKTQLIGIARGLEGQVVAQRISDEDLTFITEKLVPTVERMIEMSDKNDRPDPELVDMVKELLSKETLEILQLVGFNFKAAVAQPLTEIVQRLILALVPKSDSSGEVERMQMEYQLQILKLAQDSDAYDRLQTLNG